MHHTQNDLPIATREAVVALLNTRLAELLDLRLQAKQAHWNVKGANFIAWHELFDKVVDAADDAVDEVAERAVALGGVAKGTVAAVVSGSGLAAYNETLTQGVDHLRALSAAIATAGKQVRTAVDESAKLGDAGTSDLFTGISRELDKLLWLLEAHGQ
jgi:starvation-inducible DNA-binding protein